MGIVELKREVRSYYGIEYALVLVAGDFDGNREETAGTEKNPNQWWCLEWTANSRIIARHARPKFLWWDTLSWRDHRMMDKKNQCELQAVLEINWLMGTFAQEIGKYLLKETFGYAFVMMSTFPQQIVFRVKKLMGKQA